MPSRCAAGLSPRIIPAGFNPLRQRLHGEWPAGISNGVYVIFNPVDYQAQRPLDSKKIGIDRPQKNGCQ
jgi:hypothetical protein